MRLPRQLRVAAMPCTRSVCRRDRFMWFLANSREYSGRDNVFIATIIGYYAYAIAYMNLPENVELSLDIEFANTPLCILIRKKSRVFFAIDAVVKRNGEFGKDNAVETYLRTLSQQAYEYVYRAVVGWEIGKVQDVMDAYQVKYAIKSISGI